MVFSFGPFQLDPATRRLTRDGAAVAVADRHLDVLVHLVSHPGELLSKDALVAAAWQDVAVTDNSLEQAVSALRRIVGVDDDGRPLIQTVPRRGYRFAGSVARTARRESDDDLEALLAPHRAFLEGRTAVETLDRDQILVAQRAFARAVTAAPDDAPAHVGLANAEILRFESTRADDTPAVDAVAAAVHHAREACRLDAASAEAWATLGMALNRGGDAMKALAAARRAVALEPENWKHHLRLAFVGWGEERLRAADRTLKLLPGIALAHWLAATVHVARQAFDAAARELDAGAAAQDAQGTAPTRFGGVGLHWLRGLLRLERGDVDGARDDFERELSFEQSGHLYARECCANTWYALGALQLREGNRSAALDAFAQSLQRVNGHAIALAADAALRDDAEADVRRGRLAQRVAQLRSRGSALEAALAEAVHAALRDEATRAVALLQDAVVQSDRVGSLWLLPIEPVLHTSTAPREWSPVLTALRTRSA